MAGPADVVRERTGVPVHRFLHLMGLDVVDALVATLSPGARSRSAWSASGPSSRTPCSTSTC
jgi:hypothetical protein